MATFSGSSTVYSYEAEGRISLMSNAEGGTVSGGSGGNVDDEWSVPARILWSITYDGANYSGGITNTSSYSELIGIRNIVTGDIEYIHGPFYGYTPQELYEEALGSSNLDKVFRSWNTNYADEVTSFVRYLEEVANHCVSSGIVSG